MKPPTEIGRVLYCAVRDRSIDREILFKVRKGKFVARRKVSVKQRKRVWCGVVGVVSHAAGRCHCHLRPDQPQRHHVHDSLFFFLSRLGHNTTTFAIDAGHLPFAVQWCATTSPCSLAACGANSRPLVDLVPHGWPMLQ